MANPKDDPSAEVDFDASIPGEVETDSTGTNVLIRDPDAWDDTSELKIIDYEPPVADDPDASDETDEFDPYNSGSFDMTDAELAKAREWKTKSRK